MNENEIIYAAWRDSEAHAVPMTEKGHELAEQRFYGFKQGWKYFKFYNEFNHVNMQDHDYVMTMTKNMKFADWFHGLEGNTLRSERFYAELATFRDHVAMRNPEMLVDWLRAAFEAGHQSSDTTRKAHK